MTACMKSHCPVPSRIFCLLTLTFLIVSSFPSVVHGRRFPEFSETILGRNQEKAVKIIGSRPPRCGERCKSCGHCEAIQVPIRNSHFYAAIVEHSSRGEDISNYKPMCWKCKCGDFIFNP